MYVRRNRPKRSFSLRKKTHKFRPKGPPYTHFVKLNGESQRTNNRIHERNTNTE